MLSKKKMMILGHTSRLKNPKTVVDNGAVRLSRSTADAVDA